MKKKIVRHDHANKARKVSCHCI